MWTLLSVPCPTPDGQTAEDLYRKRAEGITEGMQASAERLGCRFHRVWYTGDGSALYTLTLWDTEEAARTFSEEWQVAGEPGEVEIRLEGSAGLVPRP